MIEYLSGEVRDKGPTGVVIDVRGVGYGVTVPLSTLYQMGSGPELCCLWIHTHVKEDTFKLFGFLTKEERLAFQTLIAINGVGPKVAIAILSTLSINDLHDAAVQENPEILQVVPGIGKRTAEKILVELKAKVDKLPHLAQESLPQKGGQVDLGLQEASASRDRQRDQRLLDVRSALQNLSFKDKEIEPILGRLRKDYSDEPFEDLVRQALALLGEGKRNTSTSSSGSKKVASKDLRQLF